VKAVSAAIVHKSDVGAVRLGVADAAGVSHAIAEITARLAARGLGPVEGFLVEQMVEPGLEVLVSVVEDETFGRLLAFGAGGIAVEARDDVLFFALPLRRSDVDTLMGGVPTVAAALRRLAGRSEPALRDLLWRMGAPDGLGLDASIRDVELNPVIVNRHGAIAVDARGRRA
jgi:acetate---CoA ligase (ADP-forming) subunit beta